VENSLDRCEERRISVGKSSLGLLLEHESSKEEKKERERERERERKQKPVLLPHSKTLRISSNTYFTLIP